MKKLKDIDPNMDCTKLKLKLTRELQEAYANYSSKGESEIYIVGNAMGDFFVSPNPPDIKGKRILYPIPPGCSPVDLLECEIL